MAMRHPLNEAPLGQFQRNLGEINGGLAFVAAVVAHPQKAVVHHHAGITGVAPTGELEQGMVVSLFDINPPKLRPLFLPSGAIGLRIASHRGQKVSAGEQTQGRPAHLDIQALPFPVTIWRSSFAEQRPGALFTGKLTGVIPPQEHDGPFIGRKDHGVFIAFIPRRSEMVDPEFVLPAIGGAVEAGPILRSPLITQRKALMPFHVVCQSQ